MNDNLIRAEFLQFVEFAATKISGGGCAQSVEDLLQQWRKEREYNSVVDDVRQGLADIAAGNGESIHDVISSIRSRLGERA